MSLQCSESGLNVRFPMSSASRSLGNARRNRRYLIISWTWREKKERLAIELNLTVNRQTNVVLEWRLFTNVFLGSVSVLKRYLSKYGGFEEKGNVSVRTPKHVCLLKVLRMGGKKVILNISSLSERTTTIAVYKRPVCFHSLLLIHFLS